MTNPSKIIEWYRPNPFVGLAWISLHSSLLMLGGAVIMAFGRDTSGRVPSEIQNTCIVIGIILVIIGVCNACFRIYHHLAKQDVSIVLSTCGLHYVTSQRSIAHSDDNSIYDKVQMIKKKENEAQDDLEEDQSKLSDDETLSELSKKIINNYNEEVKNFIQICPKEMIDKLEHPVTAKSKIKQVS